MYKERETDVVLIGAGIMSATLGIMLKELNPDFKIEVFERLDVAAAESSDAWNNAGTGHSAFCELNYTPEAKDGSVDIKKAVDIAEQFEVSKQFWSYLVNKNLLDTPKDFIRRTPHISFVWGKDNVTFLKNRYEAMSAHHMFEGMEYSENHSTLSEWMPLVMENRAPDQQVSATRMAIGTDVNFGELTRKMFEQLTKQDGVNIHFSADVKNIDRNGTGWSVKVKYTNGKEPEKINAKFVFIGAGGGSLTLLQKSGIPESKGYGGFPVSGQWLKCTNPDIIERHNAKVYGKASVGAPPMSVPHLDTRVIDGKKALLFGPYAGFSTKFLKNGSYMDLPCSIKISNMRPMISVGLNNIPLTKYLIQQVRQSPEDRLDALKDYFPNAKMEDWELEIAGQRVQIIKRGTEKAGKLEFGTEVVKSSDGSIAALLGASPGASTATAIMLKLLKGCFPKETATTEWQAKLKAMIPSYGESLNSNAGLARKLREETNKVLEIV
ncbi:malate:quinone oxidoreductase [Polluticaenibacter yanchengensis]|uniref:Probable malate:quinone oxidoreductase n=1 Tax=Polluticaenibacter yanchengensis TaxID=3014562 RepID=A0ABT4UEL4_9BACT|nr:malate:quinone oxidoreductase [Chitinophagaceae bacterium LY-5]